MWRLACDEPFGDWDSESSGYVELLLGSATELADLDQLGNGQMLALIAHINIAIEEEGLNDAVLSIDLAAHAFLKALSWPETFLEVKEEAGISMLCSSPDFESQTGHRVRVPLDA